MFDRGGNHGGGFITFFYIEGRVRESIGEITRKSKRASERASDSERVTYTIALKFVWLVFSELHFELLVPKLRIFYFSN